MIVKTEAGVKNISFLDYMSGYVIMECTGEKLLIQLWISYL